MVATDVLQVVWLAATVFLAVVGYLGARLHRATEQIENLRWAVVDLDKRVRQLQGLPPL